MEVLDEQRAADRLGILQVLTLILSVYVLVALFIQATVKLSPEAVKILDWMDSVCLFGFSSGFLRAISSCAFKGKIPEVGLDRFRLEYPHVRPLPRWSRGSNYSYLQNSSRLSFDEKSRHLFPAA